MTLQFAFCLVLTNVFLANIRGIIHEGLPYNSRRDCRHITDLIDQSSGSRRASKNKSKDIHLPSIDVNFGSNRILFVTCSQLQAANADVFLRTGATLTLAHGRRYGLIGRNGNHSPVSVVIQFFITASCHRCW